MKFILVFISSLLAVSLAEAHCGSCGVGGEAKAAHAHAEMHPGSCADGLLENYYATQRALADDDLAAAKTAAGALLSSYAGSSCAETHAKCCADVKASTEGIVNAGDLAAARKSFKDLSDVMITLVKQGGVAEGLAYLAYCPMADDHAGAQWLQEGETVMNPYYGHQMQQCGEIKGNFGKGGMKGHMKADEHKSMDHKMKDKAKDMKKHHGHDEAGGGHGD